jgi:hypothetical protein
MIRTGCLEAPLADRARHYETPGITLREESDVPIAEAFDRESAVTTLSVEVHALLACARAVLDQREFAASRVALAACPSADRLCEAAVTHGMLGHVHRLVTADHASIEPLAADEAGLPTPVVDPRLVQRLTELQSLSARRNLRQTGHLLRILEHLQAADVEGMPIKGPAWAECLYGDIALRSWVDLDVLIRYDQIAASREVLLAHGFVDGNPFNPRLARLRRGGWGQVALRTPDQAVTLELHWEVTAGFSAGSLQADSLFLRADRLQLLGQEVPTPCPTDRLLITCLNGTRDRWDSVEGLLGLAVQVREAGGLSWPQVLGAAQAAGCRRRVTVGISHVSRLFGLEIPSEIEEALARDSVARALVRSLEEDSLDRGSPKDRRRRLTAISWRSATEDSLANGLRHAAVRFFRPGPEDWEALALPPRAEWLHYLLRPFLLAVKWAKRL